jgi:predicted SAM-dependent methyltransferase
VRLNLGCGSRTMEGWVNVDHAEIPGVDVVWDLDAGPWPWADGAVSRIEARDVFEHVTDPILFMTECHRVLEAGGQLFIRTPFYLSPDAFTDPTHKRFPTEHTFDYWVPGTLLFEHHNRAYGGVSFLRKSLEIVDGQQEIILWKVARS